MFGWDNEWFSLSLPDDSYVNSEFLNKSVFKKPDPDVLALRPTPGVWSGPGWQALSVGRPDHPDPIATVVAIHFKGPVPVQGWAGDVLRQSPDGFITLKAADAEVHGKTAQYESGDGKDNIGFWTDAKDWVSWDVTVDKPGAFTVALTYACAKGAGGSEIVLAAGDQQVEGKIKETGEWTKFITEDCGVLKIEKAGKVTVSVKVKSMPGFAVMNLKAVRLKPVKQ